MAEEKMKITAKKAVAIAKDHFITLFGISTARLEEVEFKDDYWFITFSLSRGSSSFLGTLDQTERRDYKVVKIDASSGEPLSIKLR